MKVLLTAYLFSALLLCQNRDAIGQKTVESSALVFGYKSDYSPGLSARRSDIPTKAMRDFLKSFPEEKAAWYSDAQGFVAISHANSMDQIVYYDERGNWTATVRHYKEKGLPEDIRTLVRKTYFDHTITHCAEVKTMLGSAYLISILLDADYKIIRIADGEMEVFRQYTYGK